MTMIVQQEQQAGVVCVAWRLRAGLEMQESLYNSISACLQTSPDKYVLNVITLNALLVQRGSVSLLLSSPHVVCVFLADAVQSRVYDFQTSACPVPWLPFSCLTLTQAQLQLRLTEPISL